MKKLFILPILLLLLLTGCTGKSLMNDIPAAEFKHFEYHRAGNATSMHIIAENAKKEGNTLVIDDVKITADYGPFLNFNIAVKGYKREMEQAVTQE